MTPEEFLTAEHHLLRKLFAALDDALEEGSDPASHFSRIHADLQKHFRHEDPYYGLVDAGKRFDDRGLMHTLRNDHAAVLFTLESLKIRLRKSGITPDWRERYKTMRGVLLAHLSTEEKDLFPKAAAMVAASEAPSLLKKMQDNE